MYEEIETRHERRVYNLLNVSRFVGVCSTEDCLSVGNLNEECVLCQEAGRYGTYISFEGNEFMIPLLPFYVSGASERNIIPLRGIYGPLPRMRPPNEVSVSTSIFSDISYYTPERNDDNDDSNMQE